MPTMTMLTRQICFRLSMIVFGVGMLTVPDENSGDHHRYNSSHVDNECLTHFRDIDAVVI